jgi:5-methyltetrahydropteroyltriglutamate--homocysteine methyltransferase
MHRSTDRILTTHVGSLIRPEMVRRHLRAKQSGEGYDAAAHARDLKAAVVDVVRQQAEVGIDVVSDGEFGKSISWSQYVVERMAGFELRPFTPSGNPFMSGADRQRFSDFYKELDARDHVQVKTDSVIVGPISYAGQAVLQQDVDNFKDALKKVKVVEGFLPVAAPASAAPDRKNEYYKNEDDLMEAIGGALHDEYKQIVDNGLVVQLDDARAAVTYDRMVPPASFKDYRKWVGRQMAVLNRAIEGIPSEKIRYHVCWGSWPGPHTTDVPARDIMDLILSVRAGAFVLEMANPRHEHEWKIWKDIKLPKGAVLIPGVVSHATNVVEHPELIKERIVRLAKLVGRENVIAGTDCGFAQQPTHQRVHPTIQWAKLQALAEGARLATKELWGTGRKSSGSKSAGSKSAGRRPAAKKKARAVAKNVASKKRPVKKRTTKKRTARPASKRRRAA